MKFAHKLLRMKRDAGPQQLKVGKMKLQWKSYGYYPFSNVCRVSNPLLNIYKKRFHGWTNGYRKMRFTCYKVLGKYAKGINKPLYETETKIKT